MRTRWSTRTCAGKPFFRLVGILPLLSPPFVVAAAYTLLFGARGVITYGIFGQSPNIYGLNGVWGVQTIAFFPFAYQLIAGRAIAQRPTHGAGRA